MCRQAPHKSPRAHIPQEDCLIVAPARKYVALGAKCETIKIVMVAQQRFSSSAAPNARITGAPADAPSARADPPNGSSSSGVVGAASVGRVAGGPIPEADGLVVGTGGKGLAVGAPGQARHAGHVADEGVHVGARRGVPNHGGAICGCGGDPSPIWGDAHLGNWLLVAAQLE